MQTVRVFISSSGDVAEERDRARQVIEGLRRRYGDEVRLVPVLWEDLPLGADASFQRGIDLVLAGPYASTATQKASQFLPRDSPVAL